MPALGKALAWFDLIPVASWVSLGGKCRYCKAPISVQYPAVELLTAALFVISYVAWPHGLEELWMKVDWHGGLLALVGLVALALYDLKYMLLPDRILPLIYASGAVCFYSSF